VSATALERITQRARHEIGDPGDPFFSTFEGDGSTLQFDLPVRVIQDVVVTVDGVTADEGDYAVQPRAGMVSFYTPPANEATIIVEGVHFDLFDDDDFEVFILSALEKHTHSRLPEMDALERAEAVPVVEHHPIAILAAIEGLWSVISQIARDVSIQSPDGYQVDRSRRYQQLLQLVNDKQEEYDEICKMLNVGLNSIEVQHLRRVSLRTGRLVPVYRPQEIDETDPPTRVFPPRNALAPTENPFEDPEE